MAATLSLCVLTNAPGGFLAAALEPLLDVADEVVIAAGGPVSPQDMDSYVALADRLFVLEFAFVERHLAWLHGQCRGDWILRLDGDEVPTPELVAAVADAKDDRSLSSVMFARRHPFGGLDRYIAQEPWYPDFQGRMIRNDGTARFTGLLHTAAERTLPARISEAALYHLSLLGDVESRRARARRYEELRPELVAPTGLPVNEALTPEDLPSVLTLPVPTEHRELLEGVCTDRPAQAVVARSRPQAVSLAEMDATWAGRPLPECAYRASVVGIGEPVPLAPGETRPAYFRVRNDGCETWPWDPSIGPHLHLVHRWVDEHGAPGEWCPAFFTEWVRPSTTTVVPTHVQAPVTPGRYTLQASLRHAPLERLFGEAAEIEMVVREGGAWGS